jgi:hypothetical protein
MFRSKIEFVVEAQVVVQVDEEVLVLIGSSGSGLDEFVDKGSTPLKFILD